MLDTINLRKIENLHIPMWLLKDTCWMMEWKLLGVTMIIPTVSFAFFIAYITRKTDELFINIAICFWILANAFWMSCEFFGYIEYKSYAGIPFICGFISTAYFYILKFKHRNENIS